jgi:hypothetical protein
MSKVIVYAKVDAIATSPEKTVISPIFSNEKSQLAKPLTS